MSLGPNDLQSDPKTLPVAPIQATLKAQILPAPYLQDLWTGEVIGDIGEGQPVLHIHPRKEKHLLTAVMRLKTHLVHVDWSEGPQRGASGDPPPLLGSG